MSTMQANIHCISLQVRNRLNANQNAKLKAQKEVLSAKQKLLAEKKQELEQRTRQQSLLDDHRKTSDLHKSPDRHSVLPGKDSDVKRTPPSASPRREQAVSSASKKRHSSIFEVKTRQLVEEESQAFRKLHSRRLDFDEIDGDEATTDPQSQQELTDYKSADRVDKEWHISSSPPTVERLSSDSRTQATKISKKPRPTSKSTKHVQFTAESLILNAALEGELELLKECTRKASKQPCSNITQVSLNSLH